MMGNWLAITVILVWPIVAIILFATKPLAQAVLWAILGAQMVLPEVVSIKIEMIPAFDKNSISALSVLVGCIIFARRPKQGGLRFGSTEILVLAYIVCPFVTSALNNDPVIVGYRVLPSVGYYDAVSAAISQIIVLLPFFIGRRLLSNPSDTEEILVTLVMAGLIYSIPMLFEIRMSPQLHRWFYGFFQSSFVHEARYDGFRPAVFMRNGLTVAFFILTCLVASIALWRIRARVWRLSPNGVTVYLGGILVLCKAAGVLVYSALLIPVISVMRPRRQMIFAVLLVLLGLSYPVLRASEYFPNNYLVNLASSFNKERSLSLKTRFDQEQQLLAHASERFFFGWGRFGRSRVYDEDGKDVSLTDGGWIITMGTFGFIGFVAEFGLLAIPILRVASTFRFVRDRRDQILLAALALICAAILIEQLPNASLSPWTWLLAGALSGRADSLARNLRARSAVPPSRSIAFPRAS